MIRIVNKFSDETGMNFSIDKCRRLTIQRGKIIHMENIQLHIGEELKSLELNQQCKYLGKTWPLTKQPNQHSKMNIFID